MNTHQSLLLFFFAGSALLGWQNAAADRQLKAYTAEYNLTRNGMHIGKVKISLELSTNGDYTYRSHTVPVGLVALFRKDEITEVSQGSIRNNLITPLTYHYIHKRSKKTRKVDLNFDWKAHQVTNQTPDSNWSMAIPDGVQDKFSQQLALSQQLPGNGGSIKFEVADGGRLKVYQFTPQGEEWLKTAVGEYTTIKLTREKDSRPSNATFWMAHELNYLPIKIVKQEKDSQFVMELRSIAWLP